MGEPTTPRAAPRGAAAPLSCASPCCGRCPRRRRPRAQAACRSSATPRSSSCCANTPQPILQRRRPGAAEHPGRHHQRPRLQRLRGRRPAHLRQCRRADGRGDAEPDHRRAGARDRPYRRRPSVAHARAACRGADTQSIIAMLLGVGAMVAGARSPAAAARPVRRGGAAGAAGDRSRRSLLVLSCARRKNRPTAPA